MPVVLEQSEEDDWLNPDFIEADPLRSALNISRTLSFDFYTVSKIMNRVDRNEASLTNPVRE